MISIILEQDLSSLLNNVYTNIESGVKIFSRFQDAVARIYEMKVEFDITKQNEILFSLWKDSSVKKKTCLW